MVYEPFWSENGYRFWPFWNNESVYMYLSFQLQMNKRKREVTKYIIWAEFYQFLASALMQSLITLQQSQ